MITDTSTTVTTDGTYDWKTGIFKGLKAAALTFVGVAVSTGMADHLVDVLTVGLIPHVQPGYAIVIIGAGKFFHNLIKNWNNVPTTVTTTTTDPK